MSEEMKPESEESVESATGSEATESATNETTAEASNETTAEASTESSAKAETVETETVEPKVESVEQNTEKTGISQDSKNMSLLIWIGTIFFGFVPSLVFYIIKKDDEYIAKNALEALNWSITMAIGYVIAFILTFVIIGVFLFPILGICNLIFCILGAVKVSKEEEYKVPFTLRLLK